LLSLFLTSSVGRVLQRGVRARRMQRCNRMK
jgi:hypothetical protein